MTISNQRGRNEILQPAVSVDQAQSLSEIYDHHESKAVFHFEDVTTYTGRESLNRKIRILKNGDITNLKVDAVINPIQVDLSKPPVGLCRQMFYKGGPMLKEACLEYVSCPIGEAFITEGYELPAQYVIHTAGPPPNSRLKQVERLECLRQSYKSCLNLVKEQEFSSVGIPCLGTGGGGLCLNDAIKIAVTTVREWLETGSNKMEHLVFCLVDDTQYDTLIKEMFRCFPSGKDAAGIDIEQLLPVPKTVLNPPAWILRTNILCLKYNTSAKHKISYHFHNLVNHCCKELSPFDSDIDRHRDSAVFCLTMDKVYRCLMLHSKDVNMIEVQILKFCHDNSEIDRQVKNKLYSAIKIYLEAYLENVTPFEIHIRCERSTLGSEYGMWPLIALQDTLAEALPCDHGNNMADTHLVNPRDILNQWPFLRQKEPQQQEETEGGTENEPVENSVSLSIANSISSCSSSNLVARPDYQDKCTRPKEYTSTYKLLNVENMATSPRSELNAGPMTASTRSRTTSSMSVPSRIFSHTRPKEHTDSCHQLNVESMASSKRSELNVVSPITTSTSSRTNSSMSVPSRIFSRFQSLFSSVSDSSIFAENAKTSTKASDNLAQPVENSYHSNQAMHTETCSIKSDMKIDLPRNEHCNQSNLPRNEHCNQSNNLFNPTALRASKTPWSFGHSECSGINPVENTIEEQAVDIIECPQNDLKAEPPVVALSVESDMISLSSDDSNSGNNNAVDNKSSSEEEKGKDSHMDNKHLSDKDLLAIAEEFGSRHEELGIRLGLKQSAIERIQGEYSRNLKMQGFRILKAWFIKKRKTASLRKLFDEMDECDIDTYDLRQTFNIL